MTNLPQGTDVPDFREVGHVLASLSGVDLAKASKAAVRAWEARGLALIELSRGDRAEAERIMAPYRNAAAAAPIWSPLACRRRKHERNHRSNPQSPPSSG